jgi:hypothetical protein
VSKHGSSIQSTFIRNTIMALHALPTPDPASLIYFCVRADVETLWSAADVLASVDDDSSGTLSTEEEALIDDAILRSANQMIAMLASRYSVVLLMGNPWCRQINAALAAYLLATRRGDPAPSQLAELNANALTDLALAQSGDLIIPGASESLDLLPIVTNFTPILGRIPVIVPRNDLPW